MRPPTMSASAKENRRIKELIPKAKWEIHTVHIVAYKRYTNVLRAVSNCEFWRNPKRTILYLYLFVIME